MWRHHPGTTSDPTVAEKPTFAAGTTMAKLSSAGTIRIGTKFDQPLFGQVGLDGKPVGFDVEMGKLIAAKLGIAADKIEWSETVSANREPFIEQGKVDIVIATYTINDKRKQVVSFAGPYYEAGQALMVNKDNTSITKPEDVAGKKVCSVTGSTRPRRSWTSTRPSSCRQPLTPLALSRCATSRSKRSPRTT
ncbi:glutamate-binding protein [Arthrobacter sp. Hiyo4]|nr:glutamate-binding protein [Arthrobacter sp. Hiyo4]